VYKVYILQSLRFEKKTYVGKTIKTVTERLNEHNLGLSPYTKAFKPWKLIYYETFYCDSCADKREQFLKSGVGFRFRKIILENHDKLK
jgi:putative endonuclease